MNRNSAQIVEKMTHTEKNVTYNGADLGWGNGGVIGGGEVEGRADYVIDLNGISRVKFPALWKLIGERSDYDHATGLGSPNAGSTRPYNVLKFSDFYLTAAEAAFKLGQIDGMEMDAAAKKDYQNPDYPTN